MIAGETKSKGAGNYDAWIIKLDSNGNKVWEKIFGSSDSDGANSIIQSKDGGYVIAGYTYLKAVGKADALMIKLDSNGNKVWEKIFGGSNSDYAYSIALTKDGGYVVGGKTDSNGAGDFDAWILKLNANGNAEWEKTLGGSDSDEAKAVIQSSDGGYVLAANTDSMDDAGDTDVLIVKLDDDGKRDTFEEDIQKKIFIIDIPLMVMDKVFGGCETDEAKSIVQSRDGGYVLAGSTSGAPWIMKFNAEGNKEWEKIFRGPYYNEAKSIIQDNNGDYIVVGSECGGVGCGTFLIKLDTQGSKKWKKTFRGGVEVKEFDVSSIIQNGEGGYVMVGYTIGGSSNAWIIKLDSDGNKVWEKIFGDSASEDYARSVTPTRDGGYVVVGNTSLKDAPKAPKNWAWAIKFDSNGNKVWKKTFRSGVLNYLNSIIQSRDGGYVMAGTMLPSEDASGVDVWIIKLDGRGNKEWEKTFGGSKDDEANSIIQSRDGGYVVAGFTDSKGAGERDVWIIELDSKGHKDWERIFGGSKDDEANSIIQSRDGGYMVAGFTDSKGTCGSNAWIIKLDYLRKQ